MFSCVASARPEQGGSMYTKSNTAFYAFPGVVIPDLIRYPELPELFRGWIPDRASLVRNDEPGQSLFTCRAVPTPGIGHGGYHENNR